MRTYFPLCAALCLAPVLAAGQAFPPPEEAARLGEPREAFPVQPLLLAGLGYTAPLGFGGKGENIAGAFDAGKAMHAAVGLRFGGFGVAGLLRQATPGVAKSACPGGDCSAKATQKGLMLLAAPAADSGSAFMIGLGYWRDHAKFLGPGGGTLRELEGWGLFEYAALDFKLGGYGSHFALGGHFIFGIDNFTSSTTAAGKTSIGVDANQPFWFELGIHGRIL
ncbi:MAG: hypothetical protein QM704_09555 [Anaeromyxobacteraceae bacterium]